MRRTSLRFTPLPSGLLFLVVAFGAGVFSPSAFAQKDERKEEQPAAERNAQEAKDEAGFRLLIDGPELKGWVVEGQAERKVDGQMKPIWVWEDEVLTCYGAGGGFLRLDQKLTDFTLRLEYRMGKGCNSGVGLRGVEYKGNAATRPSYAGYEVQILDDGGKSPHKHGSFSLYRHLPPTANPSKPAEEWNTLEITCRGPRIQVTSNGQLVQDVDQTEHATLRDKPLTGFLSLQNHGKRISFRNVRLLELSPAPTP